MEGNLLSLELIIFIINLIKKIASKGTPKMNHHSLSFPIVGDQLWVGHSASGGTHWSHGRGIWKLLLVGRGHLLLWLFRNLPQIRSSPKLLSDFCP